MKYIPLTQGKQAIVDDEDFERVNQWKWCFHKGNNEKNAYAFRFNSIRMHRFILNVPKGLHVDHINGDTLDNRKKNLRICTQLENNRNTPKRKDTTNKYKGIHFVKQRNKWIARIQVNGKRIHSGYFNTQEEAARRYDEMAKIHFGNFARLNFLY